MMRRADLRNSHPDGAPSTDNSRTPRASNPSILTVRVLVFVVVSLFAALLVMGQMILRDQHSPSASFNSEGSAIRRNMAMKAKNALSLRQGHGPAPPLNKPQDMNITLSELKQLKEEERLSWLHQIREGRVALEPSPTRMHGVVGLDDNAEIYWKPQPKPPSDMNMVQELRQGGGFNLRVSDSLPLDREIIDSRDRGCRRISYDQEALPDASIIIVFYNEPFSTLMRSVHSVLNLSPPGLLREIILVDDGSSLDWIKANGTGELELYASLLPKVSLIRLPQRKGIVAARMAGIRAAKAPIFVILDSHIEVQPGWLEPLVQRIAEDRTRVLMPQVDGMIPETLDQSPGGIGCTLGFLWKLMEHAFNPDANSTEERRNGAPTDFVSSPTMAGGLFAADVDFFLNDIGGYDEMFQYWGTENLELSFRLWTCGGRLECAPCSRVYHIFRKGGMGYSSPPDATTKNKLRTLAVWMDNYADLAWRVIGKPNVDFGPYDDLLRFREEHGCKSFQWFLDTVNPESFVKEMPGDVPYLGPLVNAGSAQCLDLSSDYPESAIAKLYTCHGGQSQDFMWFKRVGFVMPVRNDETCLATDGERPGSTHWCQKGQDAWEVIPVGEHVQLKTASNKCLGQGEDHFLELLECNSTEDKQLWTWTAYNPPQVWTPPPSK